MCIRDRYKNAFQEGTDYTRALPHRRYLGQVISPEDSVTYMERIFNDASFDEIVADHDIITGMYGTMEEGRALMEVARPGEMPQPDGAEDHPGDDNHDEDLPHFVAEP